METATIRTRRSPSTTDYPSLDIRRMWRELRPNWKPSATEGTRYSINLDDGTPTIAIGAEGSAETPDRLLIEVAGVLRWLLLEWTAAGFNGVRAWGKCAQCSARVGILYVHDQELKCRKCLRLRYPSQSKTTEGKAFLRSTRAREAAEPTASVPPIKRETATEATTEPTISDTIKEKQPPTQAQTQKALGRFLRGFIADQRAKNAGNHPATPCADQYARARESMPTAQVGK